MTERERESSYMYLREWSILSISFTTNGERKSGRVPEDGDKISGGRALKALLQKMTGHMMPHPVYMLLHPPGLG